MPSTAMMDRDPFALALMKALGLPARTLSFELRCAAGEAVTIRCEYYPDGNSAAGFDPKPLLSEYKLVEMKGADAAHSVQQSADKPVVPQPQALRHGTEGNLLAAALVVFVPVALLLLIWLAGAPTAR